ncbi:MAG TPA: magnesium-translocating P-type ATPase [Ktedonobacterales bacterium]|nr:magnesium-translocating P-type ATPase [Ktedonobacterales bacterium]
MESDHPQGGPPTGTQLPQSSLPASSTGELQSPDAGLTTAEAQRRLARYGANEPGEPQRFATIEQFFGFLRNPLVIILLIASVISWLLGEHINAIIIALVVLLSVTINFVQAYRSQRSADTLRARVAPTSSVLRNGHWQDIPRRELVPGDVIRLAAGDLVPADAQLLMSHDLYVQQAALTGEPLPVEKEAGEITSHAAQDSAASPHALANMPAIVLLGTSIVSGNAIARVIATGDKTAFGDIVARLAARPPETEFDRGMRRFGVLIMQTVVFLVLFVLIVNLAFRHQASPFESVLFAVALAVGMTPEFLPMITTVTLGKGALHMAHEKVIVKHLAAIENFGSMDILCSDKTGTLTTGEMALDRQLDPFGNQSDEVLRAAYINSLFETGIRSPLDRAILPHHPEALIEQDYHKLDEIPFDFERRRLSIVVDTPEGRLLITKGAPEGILALSTTYLLHGQQLPLNGESRRRCMATYADLSSQGYRTLAVAQRAVPAQQAYHITDECELMFVGFLAFLDPPLPDARDMLEALRRDGVHVKILTGDSDLVAHHVCEQVGLDVSRIVLGDEIITMNDGMVAQVAEQAQVFARVSPAQKNRIMLALKARGHVVGFLGDGINDAPSLHVADVGISVASAVDIAKDAAEIILLEHNLRVLHQGVLEGRKAFGNVMKYLFMGTSSNFGNMFSMAASTLILPFLPMLPTQILLNNFLYDCAQITIPTDKVDATFIRKPHRWEIALIRDFMLFVGPISSLYDFLTFFVMLQIFHATETLFHTGWFVESLATQTLVLLVIRTAGNPLRSRPSRPLIATVIAVVATGIIVPYTPLGAALGFVPLPGLFFLFLTAATSTYLLVVEIVKRWLMRRRAYE